MTDATPTVPSAILFDVGDTLLREVRFDLEAGLRAALPDGLHAAATDIAHGFRADLHAAHADHRELMLPSWLRDHVAELHDVDEAQVEDAIWAAVVTLRPTRGVSELLDRLQADGVKMGAISNAFFSGRVLRLELERHGLANAFEFVLSSADIGIRKPDVRIFHEALDRLGAAAEHTWYVGDTFEEDVEGALRAGLVPIWLRADAADRDVVLPVRQLHDWIELAHLYATTAV